MGDTVRYTAPGGKLGLRRETSVGEDIRDIVDGVARMVSPRVVRERRSDIDQAVDKGVDQRRAQSTDSNNKY